MANSYFIPVIYPDYLVKDGSAQLPLLGHAGFILVDSSGNATYYEYGLYNTSQNGVVTNNPNGNNVREFDLGPVNYDSSGNITADSLQGALDNLYGPPGNDTSAYTGDTGMMFVSPVQITGTQANTISSDLSTFIANDSTLGGTPNYSTYNNNCLQFVYNNATNGGLTISPTQQDSALPSWPVTAPSSVLTEEGSGYQYYGPDSVFGPQMQSVTADTYTNPTELADKLLSIAIAQGDTAVGTDMAILGKSEKFGEGVERQLADAVGGAAIDLLEHVILPMFPQSFGSSLGKVVAPHYEPLVLDLTGGGIQTTTLGLGTQFDWQNSGFAEQTAWVGAGNGILVNDPTGGNITNGSQLFGTSTSLSGGGYAVDGFAALADLDSNHDGVINSSDTSWSGLRVWVAGSGVAGSGELETMAEAGIASIGLTTANTDTTDANGNYIGKTASYSLTGGGSREVADVTFLIDPTLTSPDTTVTVSSDIAALPEAQGYGTVTSLHQAMQIQVNGGSTTLETYVEDFASATDDATRNTLVDEIIYQWTGVSGVSSTARGSYFDARQLEALEQFSGQSFTDPYNSAANPGSQSVAALTAAYQQLHAYVLAGLESETNLASLFSDLRMAYDSTSGTHYWDFSSAETEILADLSANRVNGLATLSDFNQALHALDMESGDSGYATFRSDLVAQGADVAATFLYGTPVVYGTAGDDVITAWAGNQTVIASQGGNDTLIGGGANETFYGSSGSNLFIGGVGNNEVFWGGNDIRPVGGNPGPGDTFIAGQGTETFRESAFGKARIIYAAGDGNLTINNFTLFGDQNVLQLDSSITESDLGIAVSGYNLIVTDGTSGDQITVAYRSAATLEFADGTTIDLLTTGGTHLATSGATLSGTTQDDIYSYNSGAGHVTLSDTGGANQLWLGAGLTASNVSYTTSGNDVLITDGVSGDQITDLNRGVQTLRFADGSTANLLAAGTTYTLSGGATATGTGLNDYYSFASGTGTATISDPGGQNTLLLGAGISAASLTFTGSGTDLLITDGVSGDEIDVQGQLGSRVVVQTAKFSDNSTIALTGLALHEASGASVLNGMTGNDTLIGNSGSQTLNGNGGNDIFVNSSGNTTANGGIGNDTYSYTSGSGNLTIVETGGANTIVLGSGITTGNVSLTASGNDLLITDGVSGDQITVKNQLGPQFEVNSLVFAGGTTENLEGIALTMASGASVLNGTPGEDTLTATSGTQTLIGNGGNDIYIGGSGAVSMVGNTYGGNNTFITGTGTTTAYGGAGNDTYSYASGDGYLTINEAGGQNTLVLASGLTAASLTFTASGHDLLITDGTSGDQITIKNQLANIQGVQTIEFSDTSTESLEGLALTMPSGASTLYGTSGSDTLTATSGTETINGNGGNDIFITASGVLTAIGGTGNDTYSYGSGSGHLIIQDNAGTNTIVLGSGITTGAVSLVVSGYDLLINDGVSGDQITIKNQLSNEFGITSLVFAGGTTESLEGLALTMPSGASDLNGTAGNDTLTATSGTETINGNGGNDIFVTAGGALTAIGGAGNDTYSYASGDGHLTINEAGGQNTLALASGLTAGSLTFTASGHDLLITDGTSGDQITIKNQLTNVQGVQTIEFSDSSTESLEGIALTMPSGASALYGTAGSDTLTATSGTETINGNGGNDTFIGSSGTESLMGNQGTNGNNVFINGTGTTTAEGGTGNDTYSYASGDGSLMIVESGGTNTLKLGSGLTAANVTMNIASDFFGYDLVISDGTTGDQIDIYHFFSGTSNQIATLVYGDGSSTSLVNGVTEKATNGTSTLLGTAGNDTLIGGTGTMNLAGNYVVGGNDTMVAGIGTTSATGGTGNDTYSYASGDGSFIITETGGTNTLKLGGGLTAANVTMNIVSDFFGWDLVLSDGTTGDQVDIYHFYSGTSNQIATLVYGDGSSTSLVNGVTEKATNGTSTLLGTAGNDTLIGGTGTMNLAGNYVVGGNDTMVAGIGTTSATGGTGNDTYSYASGDGSFIITETGGTNTLKLGGGLTAANVTMNIVSDFFGYDLVISDGTTGDQIEIYHFYSGTSNQIQTLVYGDGTTTSLISGLTETATAGTTTLWGTTGNDTLIGGSSSGTYNLIGNQGGNDTFIAGKGTTSATGGSGNDTYSYAPGDGSFFINDSGGTDTLKLGSGLTLSNVIFAKSSNGHDLLITDGTTGDQIDIYDALYSSSYSVETLVYGDGSTLNLGNLVFASSGNTTLTGTSGNDILVGSAGNQTINGNGGSDTFFGGSGTQTLNGTQGTNGNNVFVAGIGTTSANGGTGNDTYVYASGDGHLTISDTGGTDTLKLGSGLTSSNVAFTESTNGADLILTDGTTGDQITISSQISTSADRIETLVYGDASTLSLTGGLTLTAQTGNSTLIGLVGNNTLISVAGSGTETLEGNSGNDTYSYASGNGKVVINEGGNGGTDTLKLGTGLTSSNVVLTEASNGADLLITDGVSGDQITIKNQYDGTGTSSVENLVYGDGTSISLVSGVNLISTAGTSTLSGTSGNDTLTATSGTQTINGQGGSDTFIGSSGTEILNGTQGTNGNNVFVIGTGPTTAEGGTGNDTYSYVSGDGHLTISDSGGTDTLKLGTGLTSSNVSLSESTNGADLIITDGTGGDQITISSQISTSADRIETLVYGDASTLSLTGGLTLSAQTGNSTLIGLVGNNTLISVAGTGTETLEGNSGNDTYSYASGNGKVVINEGGNGGTDTLKLGSGLTSSNVVLTEASNGADLLITDGVTGDQITIKNQYDGTGTSSVEKLVYGDGTSISLISGVKLISTAGTSTLNGTSGNDTLTATSGTQTLNGQGGSDTFIGSSGTEILNGTQGTNGNNVFIVGTGPTTAEGGTGNDTYSYVSGDGHLTISDTGGTDTLKLGSGLTSSNVAFTESTNGADLIITDGTGGDQITISGQISTSADRIENLVYGDASTLNLAGGLTLTAQTGNSTLIGLAGNNTLISVAGTGTETLEGNTGNDTYSYASGNGKVVINEGGNGGTDTLKLGSGLTSSNVVLTEASNGADLLITDGVTGDQITIRNQYDGTGTSSVEKLVYGDGTSISLVSGVNLISTSGTSTLSGTSGNDTLTATSGTQTINGNGGSDTFVGSIGTEILNGTQGTNGNNVFIVGTGPTTAEGGTGNDIYSYVSGDGHLTISDSGGTDTLKLGSGLTSSNVAFTESTNGADLIITDGTTGDQITISSQISTSADRIETLVYGDASTLSLTGGLTLTAQTGNSTLIGLVGNNTLISVAGSGTETLEGNSGNDTYSYASGNGKVVINEGGNGGTDTLKLGSGLTLSNVVFAQSSNGHDLLITDGTTGDQIDIYDALYSSSYSVEALVYGDGSTLNLGNLVFASSGNTTLTGTSGNDILVGSAGNQTINGNGGSDTFFGGSGTQTLNGTQGTNGNNVFVAGTGATSVNGGTGNDTYVYASGDGHLTISDTGGTDTLKLGSGLTSSNVAFTESTNGADLILTDGTTGDQITISSQISTSADRIETLVYGDASTLSLTGGLTLTAQTGNSTLIGLVGNNTLISVAGSGTETLEGNSGNDTYSYASGNGNVVINEGGNGGTDTLKLGTGLTSSNVVLTQASNGLDLLITDGVTGDQITIKNQFDGTGTSTVETLVYGDGSTASMTGMTLTASSGNTTLIGTAGNDTLIAVTGSGTETLEGGLGNDTYSYTAGDGNVVVYDTGGTDTIKFASGITSSNITYGETSDGNSLIIDDGTGGDQITVLDYLSTPADRIETLKFSDGSTINLGTQLLLATPGNTTLTGTSGADILVASAGNQTINGEGGADTFIGGSGTQTLIGNQGTNGNNVFIMGSGTISAVGGTGNDTYSYASGDGKFIISDTGGTDTLKLGPGLTSSNVAFSESTNGADLIITDGTTGDQITISGQISTSADRIETLVYGDASTLSLTGGLTLSAQTGNSTLIGMTGNNTLIAVAGSGTETLEGNTGNDTYSYASGNGKVVISDTGGTDTLKLGSGLTSSNVSLSESSNGNDLIILDGTSGDQVTISSQISTSADRIETLVYGNGSSLSLTGGLTLTAQSGNSTLIGLVGNNTLISVAGSGTETLEGNTGNDTYSYASGNGKVVISDTGGTDTLKLGSGLTSSNVILSESSNGTDLIITDGTGGDQITISSQISTSADRIETLVYGDASTLSLTGGLTLTAQTGNSTLIGLVGNNTLISVAGTGTETLEGNSGNDTYSYASGNGKVVINEGGNGGTDTLKLGSGLTSSNVVLTEASNGADLLITDGVTGDQITVKNQYDGTGTSSVEKLVYGDGTSISLVSGVKLISTSGTSTLNGTSGNDTLTATSGTQTLNGQGGGDTFIGSSGTEILNGTQGTNGNNVFIIGTGPTTAEGGTGNDTYSYVSGDGYLTISDTGGTDTLKLGSGLTSSNVAFTESTNGADLIITDGTGGDQITISSQISTSADRIETLVYGDGSTLSLTGGLTLTAQTGNSTLIGLSGNNTLIAVAGSGTETLEGNTGNDTYSYASGDGDVVVYDTGGTDTLKFASGITSSNITYGETSDGDSLIIYDGTSGDEITVLDYLSTSADRIEFLKFSDGSTINLSTQLLLATPGNTTLTGTSGNDILVGTAGNQTINGDGGNDTFIGGSGTQTLNGNSGAGNSSNVYIMGSGTISAIGGAGTNTYSYASGDGVMIISVNSTELDSIKLASGLTSSNVSLTENSSGTDLLIDDGTSGDQIKEASLFSGGGNHWIKTLVYGDGSSISLVGSAMTLYASSGNSTLNVLSGSYNNTLIAVNGTGTETLKGNQGNDTYSYASGNGNVVILESGGTDTLKLGSGLTSSNVSLSESSNGADLLITDGTSGDQIDISSDISQSNNRVEKLVYGDGTSISLTGALTLYALSGNSTLNGLSGGYNDTMIAVNGTGTETLNGGNGNNTYSYSSGNGNVYISDSGGTDTLKLGSGLTSSNVFFTDSTNGADLIITDGTTGDQITIHTQSTGGAIEKLIYGDGTTLTLSGIVMAASNISTLNGTTGNDILVPSTSNLTLAGKGGNDTYDFGKGMGKDYINNGVSTTNSANGTLFFGHGIADNQLWFDRVDNSGTISTSGNNLRIDIMGTTTSMTINGWYIGGSSTYEQLSEFQLSDSGLKLDSQLANLVSAMATFETNYAAAHGGTAFDPTSVSSISDTTVLSAVSSDWH